MFPCRNILDETIAKSSGFVFGKSLARAMPSQDNYSKKGNSWGVPQIETIYSFSKIESKYISDNIKVPFYK